MITQCSILLNMLALYLARHGQDEDNAGGILNGRRDQPLTELGRDQARTVAGKIKASNLSFDAIYSSPLQRAAETANIIATLGVQQEIDNNDVQKLDDLAERDFGAMTGKNTADILTLCGPDDILKTETVNYFLSPEGAETFPQLMERARRLLAFLRENHESSVSSKESATEKNEGDDSILLVTHGDFGKMFYAAYYNLDWKDVLRDFHFGNSEVILCSHKISMPPTPDQTHIFSIEQFNS